MCACAFIRYRFPYNTKYYKLFSPITFNDEGKVDVKLDYINIKHNSNCFFNNARAWVPKEPPKH